MRALASGQPDAACGMAVGRYRLVSRTRRRTWIEYSAIDERTGRTALLRFVDLSYDSQRRYAARREAWALAGLRHPNLCPVFEAGEIGELTWVASAPPAGRTLNEWLVEACPTPARTLALLGEVVDALAAAHRVGVVHRDLSMRRIHVGNDGEPTVAGFTLADAAGPLPRSGSTLAERGLLGDPAYLSPEQLDGLPATPLSDQFSFAVVAYTALYGRHPFGEHGNVVALYEAVKHEPLPTPPSVRVLPRRVLRAIARSLAVDPSHRFADLEALGHALVLTTREWLRPPLRLVRDTD